MRMLIHPQYLEQELVFASCINASRYNYLFHPPMTYKFSWTETPWCPDRASGSSPVHSTFRHSHVSRSSALISLKSRRANPDPPYPPKTNIWLPITVAEWPPLWTGTSTQLLLKKTSPSARVSVTPACGCDHSSFAVSRIHTSLYLIELLLNPPKNRIFVLLNTTAVWCERGSGHLPADSTFVQ